MPRSDDYKAAIALAVAELKNLNPPKDAFQFQKLSLHSARDVNRA